MALSLDAPIEDLKLSNRLRNVLRRRGFNTLGSLLEHDYKRTLRGFGPAARVELAHTLEANGFAPPQNLSLSHFNDIGEDASDLRGEMESNFRKWNAQIRHFELRILELAAVAAPDEHVQAIARVALIQEFRRRLTIICTAGGALRAVATLPPQERELAALLEEEAIRLGLLVERLVEMLHQVASPSCLPATDSARKPSDGRSCDDRNPDSEAWASLLESRHASPIRVDEMWNAQFDKKPVELRLHG